VKFLNRDFTCSGILGVGSYMPEKIMTNFDLEKMVNTSDEWITKRTGISERRILEDDSPAYSIGVKAAEKALKASGIKAEELDLIIFTTSTPDYLSPAVACIIQKNIGAHNAAAFDLNAACTGFVYAITTAKQFIEAGAYKYVLVVSCEGLSKVLDWEDRNSCVLFGDGAGAVVLGPVEKDYGIITTYLGSNGNMGHNITIPCCYISNEDLEKRIHENKRVVWMDGSEVFKFAIKAMVDSTEKVIDDAGFTLDEIKMIIPHQANIRIIEGAAKRLGIEESKLYTNVHKYGNVSSASVPVALDEVVMGNMLRKGDYLVVVAFGGGLTWGSALIRWAI
jgi:3-oxoacyl-[acyl-carrier-protein] synthase-3